MALRYGKKEEKRRPERRSKDASMAIKKRAWQVNKQAS